ncbi:MAG TPA: glycosyltransferase family 4 protein [Candidatus Acidoferrales bacterium]|nr:glycosyltransferase family 4 protein [Candidatus Acidoferrales bacterium]
MNILYLSADPGIDPAGQGGGSIHIRSFVRALTDLGHSVTLVCSAAKDRKTSDQDLGATVRLVPLASWNRALAHSLRLTGKISGGPKRGHPDSVRALHNLRFARSAKAAARERTPDFIYERYSLWGMSGRRLASELGIPHVLEVNAPLVYEQQQYRAGFAFPPLARRVEQSIWKKADLLIAVSGSLRSQMERSGVDPGRIQVLPNGVNPELFHLGSSGKELRKRLKLNGHFTVGFVGTFRPWHGVELLLDTFQDLHQADPLTHLLLVGDGPLRPRFEEQVRNAGLHAAVTFAGRVSHNIVPQFLAAMDVAVAPYPALEEFYYSPLKLFEYMAAGRAVVASRVGQVAELLTDGEDSLLFEPGDRASLLHCLQRIRKDSALRAELGRRATAVGSEHTWNRNAEKVIRWVQPLIHQHLPSCSSNGGEKVDSILEQPYLKSEGEGLR